MLAHNTVNKFKLTFVCLLIVAINNLESDKPQKDVQESELSHCSMRFSHFCEQQYAEGKRDRHMMRMARCDWLFAEDTWNSERFVANTSTFTPRGQCFEPPNCLNFTQIIGPDMEICQLHDPSAWVFVRVGHFTSSGDSWTRIYHPVNASHFDRWIESKKVFVSDHVLGVASEAGDLFQHPPLEQHHRTFGTMAIRVRW